MMRCLRCGAEMRLKEQAEDRPVQVSWFKRNTFKCSVCGDIEQRLTFSRDVEPNPTDAVSLHSESSPQPESPLVSLPSTAEHETVRNVAKNVFSHFARSFRALVRRLGRSMRLRSRAPNPATPAPSAASPGEPVLDPNIVPTSAAVAEPEPATTITGTDSEECE